MTFSHNSCNDRVIGSGGISAPKFSSARIPFNPSSSCNCCKRSATLFRPADDHLVAPHLLIGDGA